MKVPSILTRNWAVGGKIYLWFIKCTGYPFPGK